MSYCRFSDLDFQCDVYCYADSDGGFTTDVAAYRRVFDEPLPPRLSHEEWLTEAGQERHQKIMDLAEKAKLEAIDLPFDGETFNDSTAGDTADRLRMLRDIGYRVPQYAIDELSEEGGG